jgi:transposase-like protein
MAWLTGPTRQGSTRIPCRAIPKLRQGSYFPDWLLERRRRAEAALVTVVATSYLLGVSTRRLEKLIETLSITRLSKSQVSEMARDLDALVEAFRTRPLDAGPYTFMAAEPKRRGPSCRTISRSLSALGTPEGCLLLS